MDFGSHAPANHGRGGAALLPSLSGSLSTIYTLANATIEQIYEQWSGLGYYSRARNLHLAAQKILSASENQTRLQTHTSPQNEKLNPDAFLDHSHLFPQTAAALVQFPGFGPYTSRAVASFAYEDQVGVLDGNVIRVWSRYFGEAVTHWTNLEKNKMQKHLDELACQAFAKFGKTSTFNQAVMELGATICTPRKPLCLLCPLSTNCQALAKNLVEQLPLPKPRKKMESWLWRPELLEQNGRVAFVPSIATNSPVLKGQLILPGKFEKLTSKPNKFSFKHTITHHEIFVEPSMVKLQKSDDYIWLERSEIKQKSPFQLIQRAVKFLIGQENTIKMIAVACLLQVVIHNANAASFPLLALTANAAPFPATSTSMLTASQNFYFLNKEGISVGKEDGSKNNWTLKERDGKKWTWSHATDPTLQLILQISQTSETETNPKKLLRDYHNTGFDVMKDEMIQSPEQGQLFELYDPIQKKQVKQYIFKNGHEVAQWLCVSEKDSKTTPTQDCDQLVRSFTWMTNQKKDSSKAF